MGPGRVVKPIKDGAGEEVYRLADLVVDGQGHAHLLYLDGEQQVFYATNASWDWVREEIRRKISGAGIIGGHAASLSQAKQVQTTPRRNR